MSFSIEEKIQKYGAIEFFVCYFIDFIKCTHIQKSRVIIKYICTFVALLLQIHDENKVHTSVILV